ncbi:hypothetical protein BH23BAC2_BH23BAC2_03440 [soil metagenome]
MKYFYYLCFIILLNNIGCKKRDQQTIIIHNLRCEYLQNPLGIEVENPRLSWGIRTEEKNKRITNYQVLFSTDSLLLLKDEADLWNSGIVSSGPLNQTIYDGFKHLSKNNSYWKVRVWDEKGNVSDWSC